MTADAHYGDVGTAIIMTITVDDVPLNVSTATGMHILLRKPDGTVVEKDAIFVTDGTDGKIQYITLANDLNAVGKWKVQCHLTFPSGDWHSSVDDFQVDANLS